MIVPKMFGLDNVDSTGKGDTSMCHLSTALQILITQPEIYKFITDNDEQNKYKGGYGQKESVKKLNKLIQNITHKDKTNALFLCGTFNIKEGVTGDAHEDFDKLLQKLDDDTKCATTIKDGPKENIAYSDWKQYVEKNFSVILKYFGIFELDEGFNVHFDFDLKIGDFAIIDNLLSLLKNAYTGDNGLKIVHLPKIVVISINNWIQSDNENVTRRLPEEVDFSELINTVINDSNMEYKYKLNALCIYVNKKHYKAYVKRAKQWYTYDGLSVQDNKPDVKQYTLEQQDQVRFAVYHRQ